MSALTTETDSTELMAHRSMGTIARDDARSYPINSPDPIRWIIRWGKVSPYTLDQAEELHGLADISRDWNDLTHIDYMSRKSPTLNLSRHETGYGLPRHTIWNIGESEGVEPVDLKNMTYEVLHSRRLMTTGLDLGSYRSPKPFMMLRIGTGNLFPGINFLVKAEEFLGAGVIDPAKPNPEDAEYDTRIWSNLSLFARPSRTGQNVLKTTVDAVQGVVAWLHDQEASIYTAVSEDGLLSISATLRSGVRLFIEVDRDGSSEATVAISRTYVEAIDISTVEDLTPRVLATTIGSP